MLNVPLRRLGVGIRLTTPIIVAGCALAAAPCSASDSAPYAIKQVRIEPTVWRIGHGDNWHMTWAADDRQYTALGDGSGSSPTGTVWNTRVYGLTGTPPNHSLQTLPAYPPAAYALQHWYGYAILSVGDHLFHYISYLEQGQWHGVGTLPDRFRGVRLVHSPDRGSSWFFADGTPMNFSTPAPEKMLFWDQPDLTFSLLSALQYGQEYGDNKDGFVYLYAPNGWVEGKMNQLVLARVPKDQILNRQDYEFFVARQADGGALWSKDILQRGVVHTFPSGWVGSYLAYSWHPDVVYVKALGLYLMAAGGTGKNGSRALSQPSSLGFYTAPAPWGPWKEVYWNPNWIVDSQSDRLYEPVIAPQWMSADGRSLYLVHSNSRDNFSDKYYRMNVQKVTLQVEPQQPKLEIERSVTNALISWPSLFEGFVLEAREQEPNSSWEFLSSTNPVTIHPSHPGQIFRLRRGFSPAAARSPYTKDVAPVTPNAQMTAAAAFGYSTR